MASWSVQEQVIPFASLTPDEKLPVITGLALRVDPSNTAVVHMELQTAKADEGYLLEFNRNGGLVSARKIEPPPATEAAPKETSSEHASSGRRR